MLVHELEIIVYPRRGESRSEVVKNPTWRQIEDAIRALDRHGHPFVNLSLVRPVKKTRVCGLEIVGGKGEYGILTFDAKANQLQMYSDPGRPDGPDLVPVWTSDQGAEFEERYLCNKLTNVLRIAKFFARTGKLDPNVIWADWPAPEPRSTIADPVYVKCGAHGKRVAAIVCCHMVESSKPVGVIENSSDPNDLQAWCEKCEKMFLKVGDKTKAFRAFNDFAVVCCTCYKELKARHSKKKVRARRGA